MALMDTGPGVVSVSNLILVDDITAAVVQSLTLRDFEKKQN